MNQEKTKKKKIYISGREVPGKVPEKTVSSPPQVVNYQVGEIVKMKKLKIKKLKKKKKILLTKRRKSVKKKIQKIK